MGKTRKRYMETGTIRGIERDSRNSKKVTIQETTLIIQYISV